VVLASIDPAVSVLKFERELTRVKEQSALLQARGIFLLDTPRFPILELAYVPRRALQVAIPAPQSNTMVLPAGTLAMALGTVPSLSARAFKARFDLTDYDLRAPSLEFRDLWTDELLSFGTMFRATEYVTDRQAHAVLLDDHPTTHKPFLCLRGFREYHEHPQHSGDEWLLYRNDLGLFTAILSLWRVSLDVTQPVLIQHSNGVQLNWNTEPKA
jgi:hypothetical protein